MAFKHTFCPSPWFHMMIEHDGSYRKCRWHMNNTMLKDREKITPRIQDTSPIEFFQDNMSEFRKELLDGKEMGDCSQCYLQDQHGKTSGRQRQLLKSGVTLDQFDKSLASSPMANHFKHSLDNNGHTTLRPLDWQIDLGNYCNSNCVMCSPEFSSSLASEWKNLGLIQELPPKNWATDEKLIHNFLDGLVGIDQEIYLHLLGGETLITPGFKIFLQGLIDRDLHSKVTVGLTTNLTVWKEDVIDLLKNVKKVNLGMSIECLTPLNDYIRYPSRIEIVKENLEKWIRLANEMSWLKQIRITPSALSILHLDTVYEYAYERNITVESCNFLEEPSYFRLDILTEPLRDKVIDKLEKWISSKGSTNNEYVVNTRNPEFSKEQIIQDARSYVHYLKNQPYRNDVDGLVSFLKLLESNRKNSILDYLPEYEEFLRTAGY